MRPWSLALVPCVAWTLACGGSAAVEGAWPGAAAERLEVLSRDDHTTGLTFLPDGTLAVSTYVLKEKRSAVRFFRPDGAPAPHADLDFPGEQMVWGFTASPDGDALALAFDDHVAVVPLDGGPTRTLPLRLPGDDPASVLAGCTGPWRLSWAGGAILADCAVGPPGVLLDAATGERLLTLERERDGRRLRIGGIAVSPDGALFALQVQGDLFPEDPRTWIELRRVEDGSLVRVIEGGALEGLAYSPSGDRLAASEPCFGLEVFDVGSGGRVVDARHECEHEDAGLGDVVWADGVLFRVGRRHGVAVHDPGTGDVLGWLPRHSGDDDVEPPSRWPADLSFRNQRLAVSDDGRWLASIETRDWTRYAVRFWRLEPR